jgi:predicted nucleic acid-binding protein
VIFFLAGVEPYFPLLLPLFQRARDGEAELFLSVITEAELLVRPNRLGDREAIEKIADFLSEDGIHVVEVTRRIGRSAAAIRTTNKLGLPDALIIATADVVGCDAIVGHDKDWAGRGTAPFVWLGDLVK